MANQTGHRGYTIVRNEYGYFNVPAINCWATPTIASAKRAIDTHLTRVHAFCVYCGLTWGTVEASNPDGICCEVNY